MAAGVAIGGLVRAGRDPGGDHRADRGRPQQRARDRRLRPGRLFHRRRAAASGRATSSASFAGAVWRFRNEGNRGAFAADPDVYMPRFGGYDPIGVARGVAVAGDPRLWTVVGERLYLFSTPEDRDRLRRPMPNGVIAAAERKWPSVQRTLAP